MEQHLTSEAFANSLTAMLMAIGNGLYDTDPKTDDATTIKEWMGKNLVYKIK